MSTQKSKTAEAWQRLADHFEIPKRLAEGEVIKITANQIKKIAQREPRLMAKFDTRRSRPPILRQATILPVTNGEYVILAGDGYHDVKKGHASQKMWHLSNFASNLMTLPWQSVPASESQMLDMALASGMLADFLEEESLFLTIRGRRRSPAFAFEFHGAGGKVRLKVNGVQVEVDAGVEGKGLYLVEGKMGRRSDFHIRQLYYPFRMWSLEIPYKPISTLFCSYSNKVFSLRQYTFLPNRSYHGITLLKARDYLLSDDSPPPDLVSILSKTAIKPFSEDSPFPQANDMPKVIDIIDAIATGTDEKEQLIERYGFVGRQANYYVNAARFLGFVARSKKKTVYEPTALGIKFINGTLNQRHTLLLEQMAKFAVFRDALEWLAQAHTVPGKQTVTKWIEQNNQLRGKTSSRRASTVIGWTHWAMTITQRFVGNNDSSISYVPDKSKRHIFEQRPLWQLLNQPNDTPLPLNFDDA